MKGDRSHDRHLPACIQTFDIRGRICLRIAKFRGFCQRLLKIHPFLKHLGKDIVGRPIDNTDYLVNLIGCQTLLQRTYDRNSSGNSRLKQEIYLVLLSRIQKFPSILCNQILICRYHVLSRIECFQDHRSGRLDTAHHLDDDLYLGIFDNLFPLIRQ